VYLAGFRCKEYQDARSEKHQILRISNAQPIKYFAANVFAIHALIHVHLFTKSSTAADREDSSITGIFQPNSFPTLQ
jgi:hypothetical protein